jgi:alanyl-tRNA synthetase
MKQALDAYFKNSYKSAAACAREFDLDSRLFQKRLKTGRSRFNRVINTKLSDHQELALKKYIEFLDSIEIPARLSIIRDTANFLLYKAHHDCDEASSRVRRN